MFLALSLAACDPKTPPERATPQVPEAPGTSAPRPSPATGDVWYVISKGGKELGVLELRAGQHGVLSLEADGDEPAKLRELWQNLDNQDGIAVDMHLPSKDGEGRGPYGTRIFRPSGEGYAMAVKVKLDDAGYDVEQVPAFAGTAPPGKIALLKIAHKGGAHVGKLAFGDGKPVLTIETQSVDGKFLTDHWERLAAKRGIKVRYHEPSGGKETLVTLEAKPGDAQYANAARLYLMFQHEYEIEIVAP